MLFRKVNGQLLLSLLSLFCKSEAIKKNSFLLPFIEQCAKLFISCKRSCFIFLLFNILLQVLYNLVSHYYCYRSLAYVNYKNALGLINFQTFTPSCFSFNQIVKAYCIPLSEQINKNRSFVNFDGYDVDIISDRDMCKVVDR